MIPWGCDLSFFNANFDYNQLDEMLNYYNKNN